MRKSRNEDPEKIKARLELARKARLAKLEEIKSKGGVSLRYCDNCKKAVADSYLRHNKECPYCHAPIKKVNSLVIAKFGNGEVPHTKTMENTQ